MALFLVGPVKPKMQIVDSNQVQIILAITQTILAVVSFVASILISLFVYYGTRRLATVQYMRSSFDAWMTLDTFLLTHPELIPMARKIERPDLVNMTGESDTARLLGFIILNPHVSYYYAMKHGLIEDSLLPTVEKMLSNVLQNDEVYRLTQEEVFAEGFADYCKKLKQQQRSDKLPVEIAPNKSLDASGDSVVRN